MNLSKQKGLQFTCVSVLRCFSLTSFWVSIYSRLVSYLQKDLKCAYGGECYASVLLILFHIFRTLNTKILCLYIPLDQHHVSKYILKKNLIMEHNSIMRNSSLGYKMRTNAVCMHQLSFTISS